VTQLSAYIVLPDQTDPQLAVRSGQVSGFHVCICLNKNTQAMITACRMA